MVWYNMPKRSGKPSKHKLLQELLKTVDGFYVSHCDDEKTEVILDFKNLYLIYIK